MYPTGSSSCVTLRRLAGAVIAVACVTVAGCQSARPAAQGQAVLTTEADLEHLQRISQLPTGWHDGPEPAVATAAACPDGDRYLSAPPPLTGSELGLAPGQTATQRALELAAQVKTLREQNRRLSEQVRALEEGLAQKERALQQASQQVERVTKELSETRAELAQWQQDLERLRRHLRAADDEQLEALQATISLLQQYLQPQSAAEGAGRLSPPGQAVGGNNASPHPPQSPVDRTTPAPRPPTADQSVPPDAGKAVEMSQQPAPDASAAPSAATPPPKRPRHAAKPPYQHTRSPTPRPSVQPGAKPAPTPDPTGRHDSENRQLVPVKGGA